MSKLITIVTFCYAVDGSPSIGDKAAMSTKSVFYYHNHREFLQSVYQQRKSQNPGLSLSSFSKFCGFGSANYAGLVIEGKRNLTQEAIHQIAFALKLTFNETEYFEALVHLNQSKSEGERAFARKKMSLLKMKSPKSTAKLNTQTILAEWYYPFFLVTLDQCLISEASDRLTKLTRLPINEIESVTRALLEAKLLVIEQGLYKLSDSHQISHDTKATSLRHRSFLGKQIELSRKMIDLEYGTGGKFYAHTFSIMIEDLKFYEDRLRDLLSEFTARSDEGPPEQIMQLNIQLFKLDAKAFKKA